MELEINTEENKFKNVIYGNMFFACDHVHMLRVLSAAL